MKFIVRGIVYGFAFSLGAAMFKKVASKLGLADDAKPAGAAAAAATDSALEHKFS